MPRIRICLAILALALTACVSRDGTRLAVDIFRPTLGRKVAEEKLPVVWTHHRYRRAVYDAEDKKVYTIVDTFPWLQDVLRHGYVVAAVDTRGDGAELPVIDSHPQ